MQAKAWPPKPWRMIRGKNKHRQSIFIAEQNEDGSRLAYDHEFIAKVYGHSNQSVDKNAQLISAAPELLKLLEESYNISHDVRSSMEKGYLQDLIERSGPLLEQLTKE